MNKYEPVIGLEVHVELNTKSKMFCRCSADYFGKEPNTHTCPVCLGLPGALPYINEKAIDKCIQIGLALNCTVSKRSLFERKNYFYPDLPKGYQISQYRWPLTVGGWIEVVGEDGNTTRIRINRAHQEEDTGKLTHQGAETLIDFNRSGVPLVEIVTEPDFTDTTQIKDYAKKLQQIFRYLGVSNADMERGDMRLEANVSVRPEGQKELPNYRVELKNINSFRFMEQAVKYEIERQIKALESGEKLSQETRGWDEDKKVTYVQRSKEEAHDYRYFPEPDLPELKVDREQWTEIKNNLPELPAQKVIRYIEKFGISRSNAKVIVEDRGTAEFFEEAVKYGRDEGVEANKVAKYIVNQKLDLVDTSPQQIVDDIKAKSANIVEDDEQLEIWAKEAIEENSEVVGSIKKGKLSAIMALVGAVMKKSQGKANAQKAKEILESVLSRE